MKYIILAALLVATVGADKCNSDADCKEEECCVAPIIFWLKGTCRSYKLEGESCMVNDVILKDKHFHSCPCASDFNCIAEEIENEDGTQTRLGEKCKTFIPPTIPEPDPTHPEPTEE